VTIEGLGQAMKWSLIARVAAFAAGFTANVLIVSALSERDWGVFIEIKTIVQFVLVFVMIGVDAAILNFMPTLRIRGGAKSFSPTFRSLMLMQIGVWFCILLMSRFGGRFLNSFFRDETGRLSFYLQVAIVCFIFELLMLLVTRFFESRYEAKRLAGVAVWGNIVYFGGIVLVIRMDLGIAGVLAASAAMNLLMVALLAPRALRLVRSAPSAGTGPGVGMAGMSEAYAKDEKNLPHAINLYFKLIFLLVVPVASMGFAFARPLVPIIFGAKMLPAALLTQLFSIVFSYSFLYTPMSMAFYVMGKSWINMLIFLSLALIEIGLDLALIPRYGIWGAMVPVSFVLVLAVVFFHGAMKRVRRDTAVLAGFIVRCTLAGVPACLLSILSSRWSSPAAVALMIPAGIVLLILGFRAMKVIGAGEEELIMRLPISAKEGLLSIF
jgi:O-antigen/teichoic acid export membrane protein